MKDYADLELSLPPPAKAAAPTATGRVVKAAFLVAVGFAAWLVASHVVLANADVIERLCDDHRLCYERYCSQDMHCDAAEDPT